MIGNRLWPGVPLALLALAVAGETEPPAKVSGYGDAVARYDYLLHCAGCHLGDGSGAPPEVPPLRSMARLAAIPAGREYLVRVPEVAQAPLEDARLAGLLNWAIHEFSRDEVPSDFRPLNPSEVGEARRRILKDPLRARREILKAAR